MTAPRFVPVAAVALLVPVLSLGCGGDRAPPGSVSGRVLYGGVPLMEGRVTLVGPKGQVAGAVVQKDGTYRIENPPTGLVRAAVAVYDQRVVRSRSPASAKTPDPAAQPAGLAVSIAPPTPVVRIPGRYGDPETSGLTCQINPGEQEWDLLLAAGPGDPAVVRPEDVPAVGLNVGQTAPEIEGEDLEGKRFKLSDYRGKVAVVMFYGHWCSLSRADFAPARAMADALRDRPFVMLGVNTDHDRAVALTRNRSQDLPWRSWWDGSVLGTISEAWQIPGMPYYVVLDGRGVIRGKNLIGPDLERLVTELTAGAATPPGAP
ncbi:MAG: resA 14 [Gemmataceae bacterium]|nr:resA 14 [Gemmataceae bacterium]